MRWVVLAGAMLLGCGARTALDVPAGASAVLDASPSVNPDASPPTCGATRTVDMQVPIQVPWFDTGIDVAAGSRLVVHASGTVQYGGSSAQEGDANGGNFDGQMFFSTAVLPDTIVVSLIGKVGGSATIGTGTPVPEGRPGAGAGFVGTEYDQTVTAAGRLFLGYNDQRGNFGDNIGAFTVVVSITPPC